MKNDYRREDFRITSDPKTGEKRYYVRINKNNNEYVEVDKKVYNIYYNSYKKIYRENKKDSDADLISLDYSVDNGVALIDKIAAKDSNISYSEKLMLMDMLDQLPQKDRFLIVGLIIVEASENEMAEYLHISQSAISKKKKRILDKLRKMGEDMEIINEK